MLRRYYHHHVRHHQRFHIAVLLTIVAVSFVVVPGVLRFIDSVGRYDPVIYEPKDFERAKQAEPPSSRPRGGVAWNDVFKITVIVLAGLAWLAVGPSSGGGSRRPPRR